jgi:putative hydrolase of the HAD superfamily
MANNPPPRAILFDLDSAVISRGLSLENFAERFAADFADQLGGVTARGVAYGLSEVDGHGFRTHIALAGELRDLLPWRERPSVEKLTAYWDDEFPQRVAPDPEALPTLRWLRAHGYALGVATGEKPEAQRAKIAALGLDGYFSVTLLAGENGVKRRDARLYQRAADMLALPPAAVWMVSALPEMCLAARDAGLGVIFLQRVFYWPQGAEPPTHEIATLGELVSLLDGDASGDSR